jgi:hypothetical protein
MKKIICVLLPAALSMAACAQKIPADKVPAAVSSAFDNKFPDATKVRWDKEDEGFEANFRLKGEEVSALFGTAGNWLETETEMEPGALPGAVRRTLGAEFAGYDVEEASRIEKANGETSFEAEAEKGEETLDIILTPDGKVLGREAVEEDKDADKD